MEWNYLGNHEDLQAALADRTQLSDRLTPFESTLTVGDRLVIIQVESLGFDVMGTVMNGREVTPFLNQLKEQAYFYRVTAPVYNGSADADFSMLNGTEPSKNTVNYKFPAYPFENALPQFLSNYDYRTTAVMGGRGVVYNRRSAFEKMRFSRLLFAEEIVEKYSGKISNLGIRDAELLPLSSLMLRETAEKSCHFVVTVGSHLPFNTLHDSEKEIFPNSLDVNENYFNSVRHVDNMLRNYIVSLPANTTVVIYGDHTAPISYPGYQTDRSGQFHRVPYLIYNVGQNIARSQRTRGQEVATSGQLTLTDMANYLRAQVVRSQPSPDAGPRDVRLTSNP
jgi:phosphoglycerol transferase MdoB-like AlkP superfamily enzyme